MYKTVQEWKKTREVYDEECAKELRSYINLKLESPDFSGNGSVDLSTLLEKFDYWVWNRVLKKEMAALEAAGWEVEFRDDSSPVDGVVRRLFIMAP